jgi:ubiquinone/menaquinone biosynthesis C-methylase UbiE
MGVKYDGAAIRSPRSQVVKSSDSQFLGSIPDVYERMLVPLIFADYARDLAKRVSSLMPTKVLEIAAGTGALTRELTSHLGARARIVATDLNEPMLKVAAARQEAGGQVEWRPADAVALPFETAAFDAVACQFGAMFFPDKVKGFGEVRRVLEPGGHFLFNVWDRLSENDFTYVAVQALSAVMAPNPTDFMSRIPHGYHDLTKVRADVVSAGLTVVSTETVGLISRGLSARDVAVALCQGTPMRGEIESRQFVSLEEATEVATRALVERYGHGPIEGRLSAHVVECAR